jgi:hypothetical protein
LHTHNVSLDRHDAPGDERCLRVNADFLGDLVVVLVSNPSAELQPQGVTTISHNDNIPDKGMLDGTEVLRVLVPLDGVPQDEAVDALVDAALMLEPVMPAKPSH